MAFHTLSVFEEEATPTVCPCGSRSLHYDSETCEHICAQCGIVLIEAEVSNAPGAYIHTPPEHLGNTLRMRFNRGMVHDMAAAGHVAPISSCYNRGRLSRAAKIAFRESIDKDSFRAYRVIRSLVERLSLPAVITVEAMSVYRQARAANLVRGRAVSTMSGACVYIACRRLGAGRTLDEVEAEMNCESAKQDLDGAFRVIVRALGLQLPPAENLDGLLAKAAQRLGVGEDGVRRAGELMAFVRQRRIHEGKDPMSVVAGVIRAAAEMYGGRGMTMTAIGQATQRTPATVKNRCREIRRAWEGRGA